jgi:hypothetical protein
MLGHQPLLPRHQRDGRIAEKRLELTLLARVDRRPEDTDDHGLLLARGSWRTGYDPADPGQSPVAAR